MNPHVIFIADWVVCFSWRQGVWDFLRLAKQLTGISVTLIGVFVVSCIKNEFLALFRKFSQFLFGPWQNKTNWKITVEHKRHFLACWLIWINFMFLKQIQTRMKAMGVTLLSPVECNSCSHICLEETDGKHDLCQISHCVNDEAVEDLLKNCFGCVSPFSVLNS